MSNTISSATTSATTVASSSPSCASAGSLSIGDLAAARRIIENNEADLAHSVLLDWGVYYPAYRRLATHADAGADVEEVPLNSRRSSHRDHTSAFGVLKARRQQQQEQQQQQQQQRVQSTSQTQQTQQTQTQSQTQQHQRSQLSTLTLLEEDTGSLLDIVKARGRVPEALVRIIVYRLVVILLSLHNIGIVHRDLKPACVHLSPRGSVYLSSFSHATTLAHPLQQLHDCRGSLFSVPPEAHSSMLASALSALPSTSAPESNPVVSMSSSFTVASEMNHRERERDSIASSTVSAPSAANVNGKKDGELFSGNGHAVHSGQLADAWALGALIHFMVAGAPPFRGATREDAVRNIISGMRSPLPEDVNPVLADLVARLLESDPAKRLTVYEVLEHPWVRPLYHTLSPIPMDCSAFARGAAILSYSSALSRSFSSSSSQYSTCTASYCVNKSGCHHNEQHCSSSSSPTAVDPAVPSTTSTISTTISRKRHRCHDDDSYDHSLAPILEQQRSKPRYEPTDDDDQMVPDL